MAQEADAAPITGGADDAAKARKNLRPNALAVFRLITNSNLVDCTAGRSAGLAPLRMRPAKTAGTLLHHAPRSPGGWSFRERQAITPYPDPGA
jgi:hypothetical protein